MGKALQGPLLRHYARLQNASSVVHRKKDPNRSQRRSHNAKVAAARSSASDTSKVCSLLRCEQVSHAVWLAMPHRGCGACGGLHGAHKRPDSLTGLQHPMLTMTMRARRVKDTFTDTVHGRMHTIAHLDLNLCRCACNASESTSSAMRHRCRHGNLHGRLSIRRLMCGCRGQYTLERCDIPAIAVICRTAAASLRLPHCRLQLLRPHAARQLPLLQRLQAALQLLLPLRSRT